LKDLNSKSILKLGQTISGRLMCWTSFSGNGRKSLLRNDFG